MTRLNLSGTLLGMTVLMAAVAVVGGQRCAYGAGTIKTMLMSQNTQGINSMQNMNNMNMEGNQANQLPNLPRGYALSPVSHKQIKITKNTPFTVIADRKYYFASEQEKQEFLQNPQKYLQQPVQSAHPDE